LPAGAGGPVAEVDVIDVVAEAGVPAAYLVEHRAPHEQEGAEQPVRLDGLVRPLVGQVVGALALERAEQPAQRRAADEGAADGGEAAAGGLPGAVGPQ